MCFKEILFVLHKERLCENFGDEQIIGSKDITNCGADML